MTRSVDFYFAIGSRYCYLAQSQVAQLAFLPRHHFRREAA